MNQNSNPKIDKQHKYNKPMFNRVSALYQFFLFKEDKEEFVKRVFEDHILSDVDLVKMENLLDNFPRIKSEIQKAMVANWSWDRILPLDKALLVYATYEYLILGFDAAKAISPAIDIAKVFSEESSRKFINGVLDSVVKNNPRN